jgi:large subunit ribosomal protein L5
MADTDQTQKAAAAAKAEKQKAQAAAKAAAAAAPKEKKPRQKSDYVARLKTQYEQDIRPRLTKDRGYGNPFQVPKITKVVLNMGIGDGVADR